MLRDSFARLIGGSPAGAQLSTTLKRVAEFCSQIPLAERRSSSM